MNDERFFDLAMKVIAQQASDAEYGELDALLAQQPVLRDEFGRLQAEAGVAKEALPLLEAAEATGGEPPGYARGRLHTKVRQTFGMRKPVREGDRKTAAWRWVWWLGLASTAALVVMVLLAVMTPEPKLIVQVAVVDLAGTSRGANTNDLATLQEQWPESSPQIFDSVEEFEAWETSWPKGRRQSAVKVIYNQAAAEVFVRGHWRGRLFERSFSTDQGVAEAVGQARDYVRRETRK